MSPGHNVESHLSPFMIMIKLDDILWKDLKQLFRKEKRPAVPGTEIDTLESTSIYCNEAFVMQQNE